MAGAGSQLRLLLGEWCGPAELSSAKQQCVSSVKGRPVLALCVHTPAH